WYVGGITNWQERDVTVDLSFAGGSKIKLYRDGINANWHAEDYKCETLSNGKPVKIHMANGGGFAAVIE
ncbi:MAG: glycoside hydrolase family 97 C-terminal domain-containing protein, partial [Bacteroidales bacterium]|nr:glycoside hydrolase family 97 C-terminal domain-containing protein [Candidatus Sodaliphilus aphodohippi]